MANKNILEQMLEHLVNDDQTKAEELFHEYVVAKSREIYETLIEAEVEDDKDDEEVEESSDEDKDDEDQVDENFEDIAIEADDDASEFGGDATDDLAGELDAGDEEDEFGEKEAEKSEEELFQDLDTIVDELQARFDELKGEESGEDEFGGEEEGGEEGGNPFAKDEGFELATVREYVEKVGAPKHGDNGANAKSLVAGKNDMGGTTANIAKGGEEKGAGTEGGLAKPKTQEQNGGNINVPGGKAGSAFSKKEPGHGAEKKGSGDNGANTQSLFRGRK